MKIPSGFNPLVNPGLFIAGCLIGAVAIHTIITLGSSPKKPRTPEASAVPPKPTNLPVVARAAELQASKSLRDALQMLDRIQRAQSGDFSEIGNDLATKLALYDDPLWTTLMVELIMRWGAEDFDAAVLFVTPLRHTSLDYVDALCKLALKKENTLDALKTIYTSLPQYGPHIIGSMRKNYGASGRSADEWAKLVSQMKVANSPNEVEFHGHSYAAVAAAATDFREAIATSLKIADPIARVSTLGLIGETLITKHFRPEEVESLYDLSPTDAAPIFEGYMNAGGLSRFDLTDTLIGQVARDPEQLSAVLNTFPQAPISYKDCVTAAKAAMSDRNALPETKALYLLLWSQRDAEGAIGAAANTEQSVRAIALKLANGRNHRAAFPEKLRNALEDD